MKPEGTDRPLHNSHYWLRPRALNAAAVCSSSFPFLTLLKYVNADHRGLALTIENVMPHIGSREDQRPFPRDELLEAIVTYARMEAGGQ